MARLALLGGLLFAPAIGAAAGPELGAQAALSGVAAAPEARAADEQKAAGAGAREPTPDELEPPPRVPTAVYAYEAPGVEPELAQRLEAALLAALRGDRRLGLVDLREVVDPAEPGLLALARVQEQLEQARVHIEGGRPQQAERLLEQAHAALLRELGHVGRVEDVAETLRETLGLMASAAFVQGDRPKALGLLQAVHNVNRKLRWVSRLFPQSMKDFVEGARQQFLNGPRGGLTLGSSPGGAVLYLGGSKVGQGRATLESLPQGPHYVTWVRRNRRALTSRVVVQPNQTVEVSPVLPRFGADDPLVRLEAAEAQLGKGEMPQPLVEAATGLHADLLLLLRPQAPERGTVRVAAYLYDRRMRALLRQAQQAVSAEAPEREMPRLAAALLDGTAVDGQPKVVERAPPPPPPPPTGFERVVQAKWFWPVLGVVAGAVVAGAVVDIAVRERR